MEGHQVTQTQRVGTVHRGRRIDICNMIPLFGSSANIYFLLGGMHSRATTHRLSMLFFRFLISLSFVLIVLYPCAMLHVIHKVPLKERRVIQRKHSYLHIANPHNNNIQQHGTIYESAHGKLQQNKQQKTSGILAEDIKSESRDAHN